MNALSKVLCALGHHTGAWSQPGRHCEILRICESCGKSEEQTHHLWGPFAYAARDHCDQARACKRCGATETRVVHVWGPWFYTSNEFNSPQAHTCRRCRQSERTVYTLR